MSLNHVTLGSGLATIFGVDPKYVVLRQGTWWNPQDYIDNPDKPDTWIGYRISHAKPRSLPYSKVNEDDPLNPVDVVLYTADVDLQIVGRKSQQLAESVSHWMNRRDVGLVLAGLDAQLMGTKGDYSVTDFYQGGAEYTNRSNTVLSYNVSIKIQWASTISMYEVGEAIVVHSAMVSGIILNS